MLVRRPPHPALAPFVAGLWYAESPGGAARERALPTGAPHLAFRLSDAPIRVFHGPDDVTGQVLGHAVLAGPRDTFHVRDTALPTRSVGVQLRPGAAGLLVGDLDATTLAGLHVPLRHLAVPELAALPERLAEARGADGLDLLEATLLARLDAPRPPAAVRFALRALAAGARVDAVRAETGYSARHFIALFSRWVGLSPKLWARLARFRRVLDAAGTAPWSELARTHGYADQSHLHRDFRAFAGLSPGAYRPLPGQPGHVPLAG